MNTLDDTSRDQVADWMRKLAASPPEVSLPDPTVLWWKARAMRKLDEQRKCATALEKAERFQIACAILAAISMFVWFVVATPAAPSTSAMNVTLLIGGLIAATIVAITAWDFRRR